MRTNIEIDDVLLANVMEITGLKTKREAVDYALRIIWRMHQQKELRSLRGKVDWQGNLDTMRSDL
jgi:Arc/MetJ family transcription regulator